MSALPVDDALPALLDAVRACGAAVLTAPPGSGKTTRVPPALARALEGRVLVVEPRRMAARAAARRVAREWGCAPGEQVGWHVRFDRRAGPDTRVVFATEGILLRLLQSDPLLDGWAAVVFDEFHERSVDADLGLALCAAAREARPELVLVAMSATLDAAPVARFLDAPVIDAAGALFPVDVTHDPRVDDRPLELRVAEAARALWTGAHDLLVFLPGLSEIRRCADALDLPTAILHGRLDPDEQDAVLDPRAPARVILATNVAESSLTLPNVRAVIDSGLARVARQDPSTGLDRLDVLPIARDSADQRAGRAGRTGPGVCRRLWTARDHQDRPLYGEPALHRTDLAGAVLTLLACGEPDPAAFRWFEAPRERALSDAIGLLRALGAIDPGLTPLGRQMAALPLHPRLARFLLDAHARGATRPAARFAAWLSDGGRPTGDLASLHPPDSPLAGALERSLRAPAGVREPDALERAALAGWPDRLGRQRGRGGVLVGGTGVIGATHPFFVALAVDPSRRTERGEWALSLEARVDPAWLPVRTTHEARFDGEKVVGVEVKRAGALVLDERIGARPERSVVASMLASAARDALDRVMPDDDAWAGLLGRLRFVAAHDPHPGLPDGGPASLGPVLDALCAGRSSFAELRRADWVGALLGALPWAARQHLDARAPERVTVASGQALRLDWTQDPPVLAARIQHLFGTRATPEVCGVPVLVHLLAPNGRPQQITRDLAGFWTGSYAEVRKELRHRYPKHAWPEAP